MILKADKQGIAQLTTTRLQAVSLFHFMHVMCFEVLIALQYPFIKLMHIRKLAQTLLLVELCDAAQVYLLLDEFIMGGELQETSKKVSILCSALLMSACAASGGWPRSVVSLFLGDDTDFAVFLGYRSCWRG